MRMGKTIFIVVILLLSIGLFGEAAIQNERYNRPFPEKMVNGSIAHIQSYNIKQRIVNNPQADTKNKFLELMNGCIVSLELFGIDDGETNSILHMFVHFARYICDTYMNARWILRILFFIMLVIPYFTGLYDEDQITKEMVSRAAYYVLQIGNLMFKLSSAMGIASWLVMILRQPSPCASFVEGSAVYQTIGSDSTFRLGWKDPYYTVEAEQPFNFPAHNIIVSMIMAFYLLERYNIIFGACFAVAIPIMSVVAGYASLGQMILAIVFGLLFSLYGRVTPMLLRPVEAVVNIVLGPIALILPKFFGKYEKVPWVFVQLYLESIVYQLFVVVVFVTYFTFPFLKAMILKNIFKLRPLDIQYLPMKMVPDVAVSKGENDGYRFMDEQLHESDEMEVLRENSENCVMSRLYNKRLLWIGIAVIFLASFGLINVVTYWIDDILFPYFGWK